MIVEVASGQTFDQFLRQRIFEPLGMKDTAFVISDNRKPRVVTLYGAASGALKRLDDPAWLSPKTALFSGGGGLWSTAEDYAQFAQMLVNGGELHGNRLLSPRTVDLMASNHVGTLYSGVGAGRTQGMGFGLSVEVGPAARASETEKRTHLDLPDLQANAAGGEICLDELLDGVVAAADGQQIERQPAAGALPNSIQPAQPAKLG